MNFIFILAAIRLEPGRGRRGCANWNVRMWQLINRRGQTKAPPGCQTSALARAEVMYTDLIPQLCVNLNKYAQRAKSPKRTDCAHIRAQSDRQRARQTDRQTDSLQSRSGGDAIVWLTLKTQCRQQQNYDDDDDDDDGSAIEARFFFSILCRLANADGTRPFLLWSRLFLRREARRRRSHIGTPFRCLSFPGVSKKRTPHSAPPPLIPRWQHPALIITQIILHFDNVENKRGWEKAVNKCVTL